MSFKNLRNSLLAMVVMLGLGSLVVHAATKGDPQPFALSGTTQIAGYDGGTGAPICLGVVGQNAIMVRNMVRDGGTSQNMTCGFTTSVAPGNGMPVLATETLTVDLVNIPGFTAVTGGPYPDGGTSITAGAGTPKLCCIQSPGSAISDLNWIIVK